MTTSIPELEAQLKAAKQERDLLAWILKLWRSRRMDGHMSRREHLEKLGVHVDETPRAIDLYSKTSLDLKGMDYLLFNYPALYVEFFFS